MWRVIFREAYAAILLAVTLVLTSVLTGCENVTSATDTDRSGVTQLATLGYVEEMDKTKVMKVEITVGETEWQGMLDNAAAEEYIPADVIINGTTIKKVGIRPKGNSSLSSIVRDETTDRYSFKIKFDEYIKGQTWLGLDKIVLNNNFSDSTSLKEYLSYDIMSYVGVDAPLYAFADLSLNGETWGFYLAVEDIDSGYLERVYNDEGELYKPESGRGPGGFGGDLNTTDRTQNPAPIMLNGPGMRGMANNGVSLQYTDDELASYSAIFDNAETKTDEDDQRRVIKALKNLSEGNELETYIDVDAVLRYFAAHTVVVNLDSYVSEMGHNYYLYEHNGRISILPWDYNLAFGGFQSGSASNVVNFPIDTPVSGVSMEERPLLAKLLEIPEYLEAYHKFLQEIIDGYFANGKFEQKIDKLSLMISDYVKKDPTAFYKYEEFEAGIVELKELGALRAKSIQGQLNGTIPSTSEGQQKDPSALIDASMVNLQALGSQGPGGDRGGMGGPGGQGEPGGFPGMIGLDREVIQQAMQLLQDAGGTMTDEVKAKLVALGLSEEQIRMLLQIGNGRRPMSR